MNCSTDYVFIIESKSNKEASKTTIEKCRKEKLP